jgi:ABC-type glycerol-3-phosphate transport system substrate-binding protein
MKNTSILQYVIMGVAGVGMVAAVIVFSIYRVGNGGRANIGTVEIWGTASQDLMQEIFTKITEVDNSLELKNFSYQQISVDSFDDTLLRAIAEGGGPDLVILTEKQILQNKNRLLSIPFTTYPQRMYQDTFLDQANLLVTSKGFLGFPLTIDPLVLYYNKNFLINNGLVRPPETWSEVLSLAPVMTQKDALFNISKSTIALGAFDNISHAKDIVWALMLQAGNPVISQSLDEQSQNTVYKSVLKESFGTTVPPSHAAINFFTQFSNPTKTIYSWNRSLPNSQTMFVAGDLAFYIGYASELPTIQRLNPNLSFDITLLPQSQNAVRKTTYGQMNALAIPRTAKNVNGAVSLINKFTSPDIQNIFSTILVKSPVRRDMLNLANISNPYQSTIYRSAIMSQGILEPDSKRVSVIIKELIENIVSGQLEVSQAINRTHEQITSLIIN